MSDHPQSRRALYGRGRLRAALAGLLALASAACADTGTAPVVVEKSEPLLFVSTRVDGRALGWGSLKKDIYRMNADGSGIQNLTRYPTTLYGSLSLSRNGRQIAFNSDRSGCSALWSMNTDGTGLAQLTGLSPFVEERCSFAPRWSPDGTRIAYAAAGAEGWSVYVMNADGSDPHAVSRPVDAEPVHTYPVRWSPDGKVLFQAYPEAGGATRTFVVNADGTGLRQLFDLAGERFPAWSPDASRVAFISAREGTPRLYVMNADGSGVRRLSNLSGEDRLPHAVASWGNEVSPWSPDGTRLVFENVDGGKAALYVVRADGSALRRLTEPEARPWPAPVFFNGWSPGGGRIAFTSAAAGSYDIYLANPDGTGNVNLTGGSPAHESDAVWLIRR